MIERASAPFTRLVVPEAGRELHEPEEAEEEREADDAREEREFPASRQDEGGRRVSVRYTLTGRDEGRSHEEQDRWHEAPREMGGVRAAGDRNLRRQGGGQAGERQGWRGGGGQSLTCFDVGAGSGITLWGCP